MGLISLGFTLLTQDGRYEHHRFAARRRVLRFLLRTIGFTLLVKLDRVEGLENFPRTGPAILYMNHIAFVDPIVLVHVSPRDIVPMAKIEVYDYPVVGVFPKIYGVIPVRRGEVDRRALREALAVLEAGEVLLIAPEGTRNPALQLAREGLAYLAARTGAPLVPVAMEGTEGFPSLPVLPRWRRPGAQVRFGRPFRFRRDLGRLDRHLLRRMTDEAMYILAAMLPPHRRGVYGDLSRATTETIEWL